MDEFEQLQQKLVGMWEEIGSAVAEAEGQERTIVVAPSMSVDFPMTSIVHQAYEERLLFMLFLLRKPGIRMIYITSQVIQPEIVDYYLGLLPGMVGASARKRLFLVSPADGSARPLSEKLLDRPQLVRQIRSLISDPSQAHLVPFTTSNLERELALQLGIPMYAADPRFFAFGTKSGCRRIFAEEGVKHPLGFEDLYSIEQVVQSIARIRAQRPALKRVVVKLNESASGMGNALVNLMGLPEPGAPGELPALAQRVEQMQLEAGGAHFDEYAATLVRNGAIVEEFLEGQEIRSPSAQLRATPLGQVELLSTHDQMLGGPSGQSYLGAIFPADPAYSGAIMGDAARVGERLAREGIMGRFALDFVVVKQEDGSWDSYAIEVNLRKGGTTAPFLILQYLTDGRYDPRSGCFETNQGRPKYYVSSDHIESEAYRAFTSQQLFDLVSHHQLHYNHATQSGVVMHIITGVGEMGRVGVTAIADSAAEAMALYRRFIATLDREAAKLLAK
ncbi:MAG: peptide ligase PGM1-related protein [Chloroflexota bacterium]